MATHRPEAALDLRSSTAAHPIQNEVSTDTGIASSSSASSPSPATTSDALTTHPPTPPTRPLRPPRGHAILVQPKHDLQTPPAAPATAKQRNGAGGGVVGVPKSTCAKCTNISIMQLFYEMKQRFPTVSDEVVNECVLDYCHQRDRCVAALKEHIESNQTLIPQSYPSKSLRASAENILGTKSRRGGHERPHGEEVEEANQATCDMMNRQSNTNTIPRRTKGGGGGGGAVGAAIVAAAVPLVGMVSGGCGERMNNGSGNFRRQSDTNNQKLQQGKEGNSCSDMLSNGGSFISNNIQRMAIGGGGGGGGKGVVASKVERPCTLNLSPAPNRPFRTAPPIPSTTSSTSSLSSLSTATDLASASSPQLTASNESLNVSVNVTLSPILAPRSTTGHVSKPPIPPRHTTELTVQPEMLPFATTMPTRSFTSVNFTLRQPATSAVSGGSATQGGGGGVVGVAEGASAVGYPIDISTAGSSMTYSSSSYNAQQGYQSQLQITVGNGGGSISAIRTKAPALVTTTPASSAAVAASNLMRSTRNLTTTRLDADTEEVLINRQLQSKWKLSTELDKYRKRLDAMQRDVKALEMPLAVSAPDQLQGEIKRLQTVCDRMAAAVEEAGNFALGETNEAFYQRLDSQPGSSNSQRSLNSTTTTPTTTAGQATAYVPGSPAPGATTVESSRSSNEVEEAEGWICSKCTFQNHPELNMCEQCGMMKQRPPPLQHHPQPPPLTMHHPRHPTQQQRQQQHQQPAGIVQITSSQFIPASSASGTAANQTPAHVGPVLPSGVMPTNMPPYVMQSYQHHPHLHTPGVMQQSPQVLYSPTMIQYPSAVAYAPASPSPSGMSVTSIPSPSVPLTPPSTSSRGSKGKRGSKFKSNLSQSISNLFSSSSSSTGSNSHANSQE